MFIRLHLLRHCQKLSVQWPKELLESSKLRLHCFRNCSDIKRNEELLFSSQSAGIPSALKIKQTIKSGFYDFVDGPTCVQTSCPTCLPKSDQNVEEKVAEPTKSNEKCLFINKTTGKIYYHEMNCFQKFIGEHLNPAFGRKH